MPAAEKQPLDEGEDQVDRDAHEREQDEGGEHLGDLKPVAGFEDAPGEAAGRAGGGGEFGHHRADEREPAGGFEAGKDVGQGRGEEQAAEGYNVFNLGADVIALGDYFRGKVADFHKLPLTQAKSVYR